MKAVRPPSPAHAPRADPLPHWSLPPPRSQPIHLASGRAARSRSISRNLGRSRGRAALSRAISERRSRGGTTAQKRKGPVGPTGLTHSLRAPPRRYLPYPSQSLTASTGSHVSSPPSTPTVPSPLPYLPTPSPLGDSPQHPHHQPRSRDRNLLLPHTHTLIRLSHSPLDSSLFPDLSSSSPAPSPLSCEQP